MAKGRRWTKDEFMVVFNLYSKLTSISDISSNNTKVIHVANLINRSPD